MAHRAAAQPGGLSRKDGAQNGLLLARAGRPAASHARRSDWAVGATSGNGDGAPRRRKRTSSRERDWEFPDSEPGVSYSDLDLFPGGEGTRPWAGLSPDTRNMFQVGSLFILGPLLLSTCVRLSLIDPLVHAVQGDVHFHLDLSEEQYDEVAEKVGETKEVMEYEMLMHRAPHLNHHDLEDKLKEEGLKLERHEREKSLNVVSNTLSDALTFIVLIAAAISYSKNLDQIRQNILLKFLSLEVSTQAFALILVADVFVGYHSAEGWVTFLELVYGRYTVIEIEEVEDFIRLFVATVPVMMNVAFKFWVYRYLRKLSPGTQIVLSEVGRN